MNNETTLDRCDCCGGFIPAEGSEAWEAEDCRELGYSSAEISKMDSEGAYCPGHLATRNGKTLGSCGLFDPNLDFRDSKEEREQRSAEIRARLSSLPWLTT